MIITEIYIRPLRVHLLRHVLGTYQRFLWTWCMGDMSMWMKNELRTKLASSSRVFRRYTRKSGNIWKRVKNSRKLDTTSTDLIISSRLETEYGFTSVRTDWRVKARNSSPFVMDPSLSSIKVVPILFVSIFQLICRFSQLWMSITWNFLSLPWSWIRMRKFPYL